MTQTESGRRLGVFLCHSSGDKEAVRELYKRLLSDWIEPWFDEESLLPGQDWRHEITQAIRKVDVVIICLSSSSISKTGFVHKEIIYALDVADEQPEGTIFLIPLRLEECDVPEKLTRWHYVNLFEERGYERLMKALRRRADALGVPADAAPQDAVPAADGAATAAAVELDPSERRLLSLVAEGMTDEQITYLLSVSLSTVKRRMAALLKKLGVPDRIGLLTYAFMHPCIDGAGRSRGAGLLITDGSDFARDLAEVALAVGFKIKATLPTLDYHSVNQVEIINSTDLSLYELIILVRGEEFFQSGRGHELFYAKLKRFVSEGGKLFATPWVSWENKQHEALSAALPFEHVMDTYNENKEVSCAPARDELSRRLFREQFSFNSSFELLRPKPESVVLCEMKDGIPLFGYRHFGAGVCYYLNTCQHYCSGVMASPLTCEPLADALFRVFEWVYGRDDGS